MKKYILKRLLQLVPVLIGITFLSFAMMRIAGSDAVTELYGDKGAVAQEVIDAKRAELGLDRPFMTQYLAWLGGMLRGDMGTSYVSGRNVFQTFVSKLPATLMLTALSVCATVVISIPLGILAAVRHGRAADYFLRFFSFIGNSLPNFFVALLLMQVFSIDWNIFPVISSGVTLRSAVLPSLTLAIAMSAKYMRQVRAAVLEELGKDYVAGARARGVRGRVILWRSVLRSAMLTIITLLALSIGSLLGGTAIIESIFMWDGVKLCVRWLTYPSRQELPLLAEAAQATLKDIGIDVDINCTANRREFLADLTSWDVYASAMVTAPSGDPQYFFASCCAPGMSYNFGAYENAEVDALLGELASEFDTARRGELAVKLQQTILDDNAYVFCSFLQMNMISKSSVTGYTAHACDYYQVTAGLDIN